MIPRESLATVIAASCIIIFLHISAGPFRVAGQYLSNLIALFKNFPNYYSYI
jgi:hypothetical protein